MSVASAAEPYILRTAPGRLRIHIPDLSEQDARAVEAGLCRIAGVRAAEASPLTGNVLVLFDRHVTDDETILIAARTLEYTPGAAGATRDAQPASQERPIAKPTHAPRVVASGRGGAKRARIAVRGLDRDPDLARRVVERLERRPGVHARANPLTGRVLVEFDEHRTDIEDLLTDVVDVELPDLPGEDNPTHPLDPAPLMQSAARTAASAVGLSILAAQQAAGMAGPPPGAAVAAR